MYDAELGSHPATGDSPRKRRGHKQFPTTVDSTTEGVERQVVRDALVGMQEEVGEFWEQVCRRGPWFFDLAKSRTITVPCNNKTCIICRRGMAKRYARQTEYEEITHYTVVKSGKWDAYWKMLKRKKFRYKSFPTKDGMVIISDMGEEDLPINLVEFLDGIIERAAQSKRRISGSRQFGGQHQGHRSSESGRYWRPSSRWSLAEVVNDVIVALGSEVWRLVMYESGNGFRLIGRQKSNTHVLELAGLVGVDGQIVW